MAKRSLHEFVKQSWPYVEPAMPLCDNWHVGAICEHLEAVTNSQIRRLLINVPPGHAKSLLVSVFWPAWVWISKPSWRAIFSAYAGELALRDSVRCRTLIEGSWYQENFVRNEWHLASDQNLKSYFTNDRTGARMALSVGGKATGFRGDAVVVDDPLNAKEAPSKLVRDEVIFWWNQVMSSRLNDMRAGTRVIIMQRLHEEDLAGHVLEQGGYEHLCLPSEFDPARRSITYHYIKLPDGSEEKRELWRDPRTEPGQLLFPELFPDTVIRQAKKDLGSEGFAGQHDQLPTSPEGGMFKRHWWRYWKPDGVAAEGNMPRPRGCWEGPAMALPKMERIIISLDASFKDGKKNDFVSFTVWGTWKQWRFLLDRVKARMSFTHTLTQFKMLSAKYPRARRKLVEDKANGTAIIDALSAEIGGIIAIQPEGGKESRANSIVPIVESGDVFLPDGAPWLEDYINEMASFPLGKNDDDVDSTSQALNDLAMSSGMVRAIGLANL